jgi:hypothetical protein
MLLIFTDLKESIALGRVRTFHPLVQWQAQTQSNIY